MDCMDNNFTTLDYLNIERYYLDQQNIKSISKNMEEQLVKICYNYINLLNHNSKIIQIEDFAGFNIDGQVNEYSKIIISVKNRRNIMLTIRNFILKSSLAYNEHISRKNMQSIENSVYDDFFQYLNSDSCDKHEHLPEILYDTFLSNNLMNIY